MSRSSQALPGSLSSQVPMIDTPEAGRFPPPWIAEETDGGLLVTDVDPAAVSRAPYPAGSVASTTASAASAASGKLYACCLGVFLVEYKERRQADVRDLFK